MLNALEYLKEKNRMTTGCMIGCSDCQLSIANNGLNESCSTLEVNRPEKAIEIVENWSKEHPVKTYLDDFLEKYPNARTNRDGTPRPCLEDLYGVKVICGTIICSDCWKQPLVEMEGRHD